MGILTKEVELRPTGKSIQYYKDKGYNVSNSKPIMVKVEDLPMKSNAYVETTCDYCGKLKNPITYAAYNAETKNGTVKNCCADCIPLKREDVLFEKYGYRSPLQVPEFKEKFIKTNIERYGSVSPAKNIVVREKQKKTNIERYGVESPFQSKEIQDKIKQTNLERYGVENPLFIPEVREKAVQTIIERYGVENVSQNKDIQNKRTQTFIEHFGTTSPLKNNECLEKLKQTNMDRYGVEYTMQLDEVRQKAKQTSLERYGYDNPMKSQEILEKWLAENGSTFIKSSKQQCYICNLYNGILNHPFKCFALDIFLPDDKLDVEFDGSGHRMGISLGDITAEDFEKKELYRNIAIKREGYKQIRIISSKDFLPSDEILLQMLSLAKEYFNVTSHSWINFDIDNLIMINAENKDIGGIPFDYGKLRKIKS